MNAESKPEVLDILACDIGARPRGAASFADIAPSVRGASRTPGTLTIDFDAEAAQTLAECVAAERLCCAEIGWEIVETPALQLRITAAPAQLDVLEQVLAGQLGWRR